jgi:DNA (cytosine-5)-methyltransferase 1
MIVKIRHGSLFSGIGGFELPSEWMGWENVFHCEINPFGRKILKYYWPGAESFEDITKTNFTKYHGTIDILSGGFPCQPFSLAGKRKGTEDDRNLWPEMLRAIREIQPKWVVGENVFGIINWSGGLVFEQVQADLEAEGYEVIPVILPACGQNAPHKRERIWFVAYNNNNGHGEQGFGKSTKSSEQHGYLGNGKIIPGREFQNKNMERLPVVTHSINGGYRGNEEQDKNKNSLPKQHRATIRAGMFDGTNNGDVADTENKRLQRLCNTREAKGEGTKSNQFFTGLYNNGRWENFPTQPPVRGRNDGFSSRLDGITFPKWRNESIKAYGNAIVPQVVYQIFKVIQEMENL